MKRSLLIISTSTLAFIIITYVAGGISFLAEGFRISLNTALESALMLTASFLIIGQIQVLLSKAELDKWLQKFSGLRESRVPGRGRVSRRTVCLLPIRGQLQGKGHTLLHHHFILVREDAL